jgi:hypothetical protein
LVVPLEVEHPRVVPFAVLVIVNVLPDLEFAVTVYPPG